jgi:stage II sporulation protein E
MTVELKIKSEDKKTDFSRLCQKIQSLALRKFDLPVFYRDDRKNTIITLKEKPEFRVVCSGIQYCADDEKYSGDTFSTFEDDNGVFYAVICDGMGTGGKAAVASNLAVMLLEKLIKAGFGVVAAINTVNTSLISKSGEECSVTLDLAVVDLFTGITKYYKSGASETIVKRNGKISAVNMPSLPLGIISNTEIGCTTSVLDSGDSFIMFSDGVRDEDKDLLKKGIKAFDCENVKKLSADFCKKIRTQQSGKRDDLTVLSVYIEENE